MEHPVNMVNHFLIIALNSLKGTEKAVDIKVYRKSEMSALWSGYSHKGIYQVQSRLGSLSGKITVIVIS